MAMPPGRDQTPAASRKDDAPLQREKLAGANAMRDFAARGRS